MIVVSDTSPVNYLVLIGCIHVLNSLYEKVAVPPAVWSELQSPRTPVAVRDWVVNAPEVIGTLGILRIAALRGLIDLPEALSQLRQTSFYASPDLIQFLLEEDARRKGQSQM